MKYLLAIDLETTGLDPQYHEIVEIGAVLLDNKFNELGTFEYLVCPEYPERALSFNDDGTVRNNLALFNWGQLMRLGENIYHTVTHLENFVRGHVRETKEVCLFGQNIKFDDGFLRAAYKQCEQDWPFDYHAIDLVSMWYQWYMFNTGKPPESLSLKKIGEYFEIDNPTEHRALADIQFTIQLARKMS